MTGVFSIAVNGEPVCELKNRIVDHGHNRMLDVVFDMNQANYFLGVDGTWVIEHAPNGLRQVWYQHHLLCWRTIVCARP